MIHVIHTVLTGIWKGKSPFIIPDIRHKIKTLQMKGFKLSTEAVIHSSMFFKMPQYS